MTRDVISSLKGKIEEAPKKQIWFNNTVSESKLPPLYWFLLHVETSKSKLQPTILYETMSLISIQNSRCGWLTNRRPHISMLTAEPLHSYNVLLLEEPAREKLPVYLRTACRLVSIQC